MDSSLNLNGAAASPHTHDSNWEPPRSRTRNAIDMVSSGGIGPGPRIEQIHDVNEALDLYAKQYLPGQKKSIPGIAVRSLLLGVVFTLSTNLTLFLLFCTGTPLWRLPFFLTILSTFHFLEFWTTARYNPPAMSISSFLLSQNGSAYIIAHTGAIAECLLRNTLLCSISPLLPSSFSNALIVLSLCLMVVGQAIRSYAMITAGTNFNHIVQHTRKSTHTLVTDGIYAWLRHPSYFGYFWWGLGTQIMMGNVVGFIGYTVVLWTFFYRRIGGEEALLIKFFGDDYVQYKKRSWVGIPFI
jgi:protein-S-isoprenylcysteine O-methyltransferase